MPDAGIELKRVVDLVTQSDVDSGVYTLIDSVSGAVKKYPLGSFIASVAPIFDATAAYSAGDYCNYNGQIYRFTADHAAGSWTGSDATAADIGAELSNLKQELSYTVAELGEPDDYHTTNMINENALTQSKMLADDGTITNAPNDTWYVTGFLDVGNEKTLYLKVENTSSNLIHCYDSSQNPIGERITASSSRLTSHTTYYDVALYPGTKYVRLNVRTAWLGRYMLTKYFYPSSYVAYGSYVNRTPSTVASKSELSYSTYRTEGGIIRNYYSGWNAQLTNGSFSLLNMPQNSIAYVNLTQMTPSEIAGLPFSSGAVYVEKIGRGDYSFYRVYKNGDPFVFVGFYSSGSFIWRSMPNFNTTQIGMLGDSVTEGRIGGTSSITSKGIPYWVGLETGLKVTNLGVGNMGWASHQYLQTNAYEYLQTLDLSSYDVLTFQYGLNDGDIALGDYLDTSEETIMGYVYRCINYVYTVSSNVQVIIINPTVGSKPDSFPYFNPDAHHSASDGWTFTDFFEQMRSFCDKYAIPFIDGWKGLNAWNRKTLIGDNVHPTEKGYQVLGRYIAGQIKSMI